LKKPHQLFEIIRCNSESTEVTFSANEITDGNLFAGQHACSRGRNPSYQDTKSSISNSRR